MLRERLLIKKLLKLMRRDFQCLYQKCCEFETEDTEVRTSDDLNRRGVTTQGRCCHPEREQRWESWLQPPQPLFMTLSCMGALSVSGRCNSRPLCHRWLDHWRHCNPRQHWTIVNKSAVTPGCSTVRQRTAWTVNYAMFHTILHKLTHSHT